MLDNDVADSAIQLRAHRKNEAQSNYELYESQWKTQDEEEQKKESNKKHDDSYEDDKTYAQVSVVEDFSID